MPRITTCLAATAAGLALASPAQAATSHSPDVVRPQAADSGAITLTGPQVKHVQQKSQPKPAWKIALNFAMRKRGIPYVWGGTSDSGYDCSGLTLKAYAHAGIELPRTAAEQYNAFSRKISWNHLKPGDLVFFHGLGHVGMVSRPGYMVNAPHTGDVVKEEPLSDWRREAFVGAVRPDPKGVRLSTKQHNDPPPAMLTATL
ncbi:C40 family peptidase [Nonomuraea sp. B12E4]|uniref:C40 family peptidase n=1 Tax=Nonomuraea sp. B12E4 TaxID=3153564 RepID=UPI00325DAA37